MSRWSSWLTGIRFVIDAPKDLDWSRPYIICANHTSNLDISALNLACPADFSFIGKQELLNNIITGIFFRSIDLPLNRSSKIAAFRTMKKAETLLSEGKSIAIFPEGTILENYPPILGPFKNGPFKLSKDTNTAILPVIIHDAWKICWDDGKKLGTKPGHIRVEILDPIHPNAIISRIDSTLSNTDEVEAFRETVHKIMCERWLQS
jgi:1-acyl-sn-glycerol-3-phosphate acyltransferase